MHTLFGNDQHVAYASTSTRYCIRSDIYTQHTHAYTCSAQWCGALILAPHCTFAHTHGATPNARTAPITHSVRARTSLYISSKHVSPWSAQNIARVCPKATFPFINSNCKRHSCACSFAVEGCASVPLIHTHTNTHARTDTQSTGDGDGPPII